MSPLSESTCVCVCVSVSVWVHACMHVFALVCVSVCIHTCVNTQINAMECYQVTDPVQLLPGGTVMSSLMNAGTLSHNCSVVPFHSLPPSLSLSLSLSTPSDHPPVVFVHRGSDPPEKCAPSSMKSPPEAVSERGRCLKPTSTARVCVCVCVCV